MFGGRVGDLRDAVVHHLGSHAADGAVREVSSVQFVCFVRTGAQLICPRGADVADDFAEVEVVRNEFVGECLKKFWVGRGVGDADVVHGFYDAAADVLGPDEVCHVFGEPRVIFGPDPIGEELATVSVLALGCFAAEEFWWDDDVTDGVLGFAGAAIVNDAFAGIFAIFASDLGEEGDEASVVFHCPAVERVVVALCALDSDSEEGLGGIFCVLKGIGFCEEEVCGGVLEIGTVCAEEACGDFVERQIVVQLLFDPGVVRDYGLVIHLPLLIGRDLEEFTPFEGPDVDELMAGDEAINEFLAFCGIFVVHEFFDLLTGWENAVDVDKGAACEGGIIAESAWNQAKVLEFFVNESVDVVLFLEFGPFVLLAFRHDDDL